MYCLFKALQAFLKKFEFLVFSLMSQNVLPLLSFAGSLNFLCYCLAANVLLLLGLAGIYGSFFYAVVFFFQLLQAFLAELWHAKRACGAPWVSKSTHPRKFDNHVTVHRPPAARPSAPQGNQCSIPHFLASLGAQEN